MTAMSAKPVGAMDPEFATRTLVRSSKICGQTLARAHARSGDAVAIGAYLGSGDAMDRALAEFAELYADQNELDYAALSAAVKNGNVKAEAGL
jgi:predicted alpha/beta hydrolase